VQFLASSSEQNQKKAFRAGLCQISGPKTGEASPAFGLIGRKLSHSFSYKYFTKKFHRLELNCKYRLFEIDSLAILPELLKAFPQLRGLNVTIPYKTDILGLVDAVHPSAQAIGAANTLLRSEDGFWTAYNTDCQGFELSLSNFLQGAKCPPTLILGTGGAAKAMDFVLRNTFLQPEIKNSVP